jgi:hypothetical protein
MNDFYMGSEVSFVSCETISDWIEIMLNFNPIRLTQCHVRYHVLGASFYLFGKLLFLTLNDWCKMCNLTLTVIYRGFFKYWPIDNNNEEYLYT